MIKRLLIILMVVFGVSKSGMAQDPGISPAFKERIESYLSHSIPTLTVKQLREQQEEFVILDTREKDEFLVSHISGAIPVGYDYFKLKNLDTLDRQQKIVLYCSIGYRSEKVAEILKREGFTQVYNLYGSLFAWANAGYPLVDKSGNTTNRIHGYNTDWSRWISNPALEIVH